MGPTFSNFQKVEVGWYLGFSHLLGPQWNATAVFDRKISLIFDVFVCSDIQFSELNEVNWIEVKKNELR